MGLWSKKSISALQAEAAAEGTEVTLKRALGAMNLTMLGIGAIIGAGIFVLTGTAAAQYAGPAIVLVVHRRRLRLFVRRPLLRRVRGDDPDRRKRVHVRLRDDGRARRLDHRLGLDPRVLVRRGDGGGRLVRDTSTTFFDDFGISLPESLTRRHSTSSERTRIGPASHGGIIEPARGRAHPARPRAARDRGTQESAWRQQPDRLHQGGIVILVIGFGFMLREPGELTPVHSRQNYTTA